jgi:hypothetical protein
VRSMRLESALERRVLGSCLAAYRRQLCIGDRGPSWQALVSKSHWQFIGYDFTRVSSASATHVEFHNSSQIIQCSRIFSSARIRESHVYGIIGTIAQWLIPAMEDKDAPWPGTLALGACVHLSTHRSHRRGRHSEPRHRPVSMPEATRQIQSSESRADANPTTHIPGMAVHNRGD